jgi:hypothetical protein
VTTTVFSPGTSLDFFGLTVIFRFDGIEEPHFRNDVAAVDAHHGAGECEEVHARDGQRRLFVGDVLGRRRLDALLDAPIPGTARTAKFIVSAM